MATYFWAPQTGNNANSGTSFLSPKKDFSSFGTFAPGDVVFGLNGEIHDGAALGRVAPAFSSSPSAASPWTLMPYPGHPRIVLDGGGTRDIGFRPAAAIDQANPPTNLIVQGLEIRRYTANGANIGEVSADGSNYNGAVFRDLWVHDIASASEAGLKYWGTDVRVEDCLFEDIGGDGVFYHGARTTGLRNTIRRVSNTGGGLGDGIQSAVNSHGAVWMWNDIARENKDKQAALLCGDDIVFACNTVRGLSEGAGAITLFSSGGTSARGLLYGNYLHSTDGIYFLDATGAHRAIANILVGLNPAETDANSTGIDMNGTQNHLMAHNLVINHRRGIFGRGTIRNNIALNCGGTGIDVGAGAVVESHNLSFGNGTNFSATPGVGSLQLDPLLLDPSRPWLGLHPDSPCWNAGVFITGSYDWNGKEMQPSAPPIGPFQKYGSRSNASSRSVGSRSLADRDLAYRLGIAA